ncbi:MAG TPA: hypothetical protein DHW15_12285, partial [Bacteroidetes bacterium]|nr:hypothetical protein [Bacteroidota bacterium]
NRRYRNTVAESDGRALPLEAYLADFDKNGKEEFIMAYYQHDALYPVKTRERLLEQMPSIGEKFPDWDSFGKADLTEMFGAENLDKAIHKSAYIFNSAVLINEGKGKFSIKFLPNEAQISVLFGMVTDDFNNDGFVDILTQGNFYNTEIEITRHDAGTGILLLGNGDGTFQPARSYITGFRNDGDSKGMAVILAGAKKQPVYLLGNADGPMASFKLINPITTIPMQANDARAIITMKDGSKRTVELYAGSGYLSQSSKFIRLTPQMESIEAVSYSGARRMVYPAPTAAK